MVVLFDIDDTLLQNGKYPDNFNSIKKLIKELKEKVSFGICTFRPYNKSVKKIIADYGIEGPIFTEGGAHYLDDDVKPINIIIKNIIANYFKESNINIDILISSNYEDCKSVIINKDRIKTSTIRLPKELVKNIDLIIKYLKNNDIMKKMNITKSSEFKIDIYPSNINKIDEIGKHLKNDKIILVTDHEDIVPKHSSSISIYSVGDNSQFNLECDKVFSLFGNGVEEILLMIRREL